MIPSQINQTKATQSGLLQLTKTIKTYSRFKILFVTYTIIQSITSSEVFSQVRSMDSAIIWNTNIHKYT